MQSASNQYTLSVLAAAVIFGLAACGKGDTPPPTSSYGKQSTVSKTELAEKQEITIDTGGEPESLDPHKTSDSTSSFILRQMFVGLTTTDKDGNTIPGMALSWDSPDNKVWTFKLRDAKWSNGDPVTVQDFVYSFRRLVNPATASPYASYLDDAKVVNARAIVDGKAKPETLGIKALDDKTLQITLTEAVPYFPDVLVHTSPKPVHAKTVEKYGDKWVQPENIVVNGAYKLAVWDVNSQIVLERNPLYYDNANTTINRATLLPIAAASASLSRYKTGELDISGGIPPGAAAFQKLKQEMGSQLKVSPALCTYYYGFNVNKAPFNNRDVRKALQLALDRDIIVEKVLGAGQTAAYQFTPPATQGMKNFTPEWQSWSKEKRIEEARKLLAKAGYGKNKPLSFELLYNTSEGHKAIAVAAVDLWKKAFGDDVIKASLVNQEWKIFLDTKRQQRFQMARAGWCADYNEASTFLNLFKSTNSNNDSKYNSAEFDDLMHKTLAGNVSSEQRGEYYRQAEAVLDKDVPVISVYHYVGSSLVKPHVDGYSLKNPTSTRQIKDFKILKH